MPFARGNPGGPRGRRRGKRTAAEIMERLHLDPISAMCAIAQRRVPCGTCIDENGKPTGSTRYKLPEGRHATTCGLYHTGRKLGADGCNCGGYATRVCESCYGSKWERISVGIMLEALDKLARYKHPTLRAIEVQGMPAPTAHQQIAIVLVQPGDQVSGGAGGLLNAPREDSGD